MTDATTSREAAERAYNPRLAVPEVASIIGLWPARAEATRRRHPPLADLRYGDHPREVIDLFRAGSPRGTVLFIHGGYWRALSKDDVSWVADGFLGQGISVAVLNYPLCPEVTLARIAETTRRAFARLHGEVLLPAERDRIVVAGHSAGGYLAALHLATDWREHGLPPDPIAGIVPISGVFSLAPLLDTSMNEAIRLDRASAASLSLLGRAWRSRAAVAFAVGSHETAAFHRQSAEMAESWSDLLPRVMTVPGRHHFDVLDDLALPGTELNRTVIAMLRRDAD